MTKNPIESVQPKLRFRALDSLRGFAAMIVAFGHFGSLGEYSGTYYLAVDFFLLLSGFVLAHAYFVESRISFSRFVWRRWARMYPLHFLTLVYIVVGALAVGASPDISGLILHLLFIQNVGFGPDRLMLNGPSWTIAVEFWVNVGIYALVCLLGGGIQRRLLIVFAVISAVGFAITARYTGHLDANTADYGSLLNSGLVRCVASFCLGILAYAVHLAAPYRRHFGVEYAALVVFLLSMLSPKSHSMMDFMAPPIYFLVVLVFASETGIVSRILSKIAMLGDISFSIYLLHIPIILTARILFPSIEPTLYWSAVFISVVLLSSALCYRYIELPAYRKLVSMNEAMQLRH